MVYSTAERVCLVEHYFRSGSYAAAKEALRNLNPLANVPADSTLKRLVDRFRETGSVLDEKRCGRPSLTEEDITAVHGAALNSPKKSVRKISQQTDISKTSVHKIMRRIICLFPYKIRVQHSLNESDHEQRLLYCDWLINVCEENPDFCKTYFMSDEAWFHLSGYVNSQNNRYWAASNPHRFTESSLHPLKIGVWAVISGERIFHRFFEGRVNSQIYCNFLDEFAATLTDREKQVSWFQQDNATAHTARATLDHIKNLFGERTVSKGLYPPRSPDLSTPDFFLWGCLKDTVYGNNPRTLDDLKTNISEAILSIDKDTLLKVSRNALSRCFLCKTALGGHFQHLM